jgi:hypothetical protein
VGERRHQRARPLTAFLRCERRKKKSSWKQRGYVDERKRRDEKRDEMGEEEMETQDGM